MHATPDYVGRTYRYTRAAMQYPFGFGLSYTAFDYTKLSVQPGVAAPCDQVTVSVDVTNTGARDGSEVVQLYVSLPNTMGVPVPVQALANFTRVHVPAGQTVTVTLAIRPLANSLMRDGDYIDMVVPGMRALWIGGSSAHTSPGVSGSFATSGSPTPARSCPS